MRRVTLLLLPATLALSCAWPSIGEGIASLLPTPDMRVAATLAYPYPGTLDAGALTQQITIVGAVVDQYGAGMSDVVICYGPNEGEAVAIGVTDSTGAYSAMPPQSFGGTEGNLIWAYLPLYRFEPDWVEVGILIGENTLDFKAYPSIYPVPPERDCR